MNLQLPMQSVPITTNVVSSNPVQARCIRYNSMSISLWVTCGRSVVFSGYSGFFHQYNLPLRYNWNNVESGVKYHKPPSLDHCRLMIIESKNYLAMMIFVYRIKCFINNVDILNKMHYYVYNICLINMNKRPICFLWFFFLFLQFRIE